MEPFEVHILGCGSALPTTRHNATSQIVRIGNKQFMIDYVCPKCGNFLGYVPFEALANKSVCSFCKCKWT